MIDRNVLDRIAVQNREMRALADGARREAIQSAPNVAGYDRFADRARQVQVRDSYRAFGDR